MAAAKRLKVPAGPPAPQDPQECATAIAAYGAVAAERRALVEEMNERQRAIGDEYQARITALDDSLKIRLMSIQTYAEAHRKDADERGVKYIEFTTGRVEWRKDQDSITAPAKDDNLVAVINMLYEKNLGRFVRIRKEVNKEAMLAEREHLPGLIAGIPGLGIRQGKESFTVKPLEIDPS